MVRINIIARNKTISKLKTKEARRTQNKSSLKAIEMETVSKYNPSEMEMLVTDIIFLLQNQHLKRENERPTKKTPTKQIVFT